MIRDYCVANNKILYDFYDIECYDPDGNYYGNKPPDDALNYDSNGDGVRDSNWGTIWQNANPGKWFACESPHSQPITANMKAYAAWWLWARLAGGTAAKINYRSFSLRIFPESFLGRESLIS
ncbi:MAG: hypothetical protein MZU79_06005 [Anaerotruncus sp.]|nr:hypothetical protein [Anaerotruncus sp.]